MLVFYSGTALEPVKNKLRVMWDTLYILFNRTLHLYISLVGMTQKEREEGANHTLLKVKFITYQQHSLLSNIPL